MKLWNKNTRLRKTRQWKTRQNGHGDWNQYCHGDIL